MATLKLNKFILLPYRTVSALVRCGFAVTAGIMMKTFSPDTGRIFYENAMSDYLLHKFPEIMRWYEDCPYPTGRLTVGSPVWVFLPKEGQKEGDELLRSVRKEIDNRPIRVITRENYRRCISLPGPLALKTARPCGRRPALRAPVPLPALQAGRHVCGRTQMGKLQEGRPGTRLYLRHAGGVPLRPPAHSRR